MVGQAEIPALERERQRGRGFKAGLCYTMFKSEANLSYLSPCLKKLKQKDPCGTGFTAGDGLSAERWASGADPIKTTALHHLTQANPTVPIIHGHTPDLTSSS